MRGQCSAIKADGKRCRKLVEGPHGLCWTHDPKNAKQRIRIASRAGRSKANRDLALLKEELKALKDDVLEGRVDRNDAAVVVQVYRALKDLIELERRIKETDQIASEVEELKREYGVAG